MNTRNCFTTVISNRTVIAMSLLHKDVYILAIVRILTKEKIPHSACSGIECVLLIGL